MKIRTGLKILAVAYVLVILLAGWLILSTISESITATEKEGVLNDLSNGVFELNALSSDYLVYGENLSLDPWYTKHESTTEKLHRASETFSGTDAGEIIRSVQNESEDLRAIFRGLVSERTRENATAGSGSNARSERDELLGAELLAKSRSMASKLSELSYKTKIDVLVTQKKVYSVIMIFIVTIIASSAATMLVIQGIVLNPIEKLRKGAEAIGRGSLDYRVALSSDNELGQLAATFNDMAKNLDESKKALMASREQYITLFNESPIAVWEEDFSRVKAYVDELRRRGVTDFLKYLNENSGEVAKCAAMVRVKKVNKEALKMYGAESENELLNHLGTISNMDLGGTFKNELAAIADGRDMFDSETLVQVLHNGTRNIHIRWVVLNDTEKSYSCVLVSMVDITEWKTAQEAVKASETKFRRLFEAAQDGILILDADTGAILEVNPFLINTLGYPREEFLGKKLWELGIFKDIAASRDAFLELKKNEYVRYEDLPLQTKDGRRIEFEFVSNLYLVGNKKVMQCNIRDITERKKAERALIASKKEIEAACKELENYTYVVSHDLKEPLRSIEGFSQLLIEDKSDKLDDAGREYLHRIVRASGRMSNLITDLLKLSRIGHKDTEFKKVNLNSMLDGIKLDLAELIKQTNGRIAYSGLPTILCQPTWMAEAFRNLISNGLKFNKNPVPKVTITCVEKDVDYEFSISDNGIGIEPKYFGRIFKLFERLHSRGEYEGSGAGLAIVKSVIEQHQGRIWVDMSEPGGGSTFKFTLPKAYS